MVFQYLQIFTEKLKACHRRRKVYNIEEGGKGGGGANSRQKHEIVLTSMRRNDVASRSFRHHVSTMFLKN